MISQKLRVWERKIAFVEKLSRALDGVATHRTYFREKKLTDKMNVDEQTIRVRLRELHEKGW